MYLFQYQCCFQTTSVMDSIGTPLVSGMKKRVKTPMTKIHAAKKKKIQAFIPHNMVKKA